MVYALVVGGVLENFVLRKDAQGSLDIVLFGGFSILMKLGVYGIWLEVNIRFFIIVFSAFIGATAIKIKTE